MATPLLRYIAFNEYYKVIVENLPQLSVAQIRQIESYAASRRGRLDFNNFSFTIYKRIDFEHFNKTLVESGIYADTIESEIAEAKVEQPAMVQDPMIGFGKYRGTKYKDLPDDYLRWLKQNYQGPDRNTIDQECIKRSI